MLTWCCKISLPLRARFWSESRRCRLSVGGSDQKRDQPCAWLRRRHNFNGRVHARRSKEQQLQQQIVWGNPAEPVRSRMGCQHRPCNHAWFLLFPSHFWYSKTVLLMSAKEHCDRKAQQRRLQFYPYPRCRSKWNKWKSLHPLSLATNDVSLSYSVLSRFSPTAQYPITTPCTWEFGGHNPTLRFPILAILLSYSAEINALETGMKGHLTSSRCCSRPCRRRMWRC